LRVTATVEAIPDMTLLHHNAESMNDYSLFK